MNSVDFDLTNFIEAALKEDVRDGDHTTLACIPDDHIGEAILYVKENGIIAGIDVARAIFSLVDSSLEFKAFKQDGDAVQKGEVAFKVYGKVQFILTAERLVLNTMQRMSGIATVTKTYVNLVAHTNSKLLDTRKTTPGMRWFEKYAVRIGGGFNHRYGLFDMILIKDNHVDAAGSISTALDRVHDYLTVKNLDLKVEIEVRNFKELEEALDHGGVDRIMLDNFTVESTKEAVRLVNGRVALESSGGITLETIRQYAETGVDYISVGALTHSVKALDLSLKINRI
jgi:nicotinate-nucleotide pyrophosphorylase (carboxylating)